jgi:hypothetical protein
MPGNLRKFLPDLSEEERMRLYGDIPRVLSYPRGHPVREGVILGELLFLSPTFVHTFAISLITDIVHISISISPPRTQRTTTRCE